MPITSVSSYPPVMQEFGYYSARRVSLVVQRCVSNAMPVSITLPTDLEQFLQTHARSVSVPFKTLLTGTIVER